MSGKKNISLTVNGEPSECAHGFSLKDYITRAGIESGKVVVEVNGNILKPEAFALHALNDGDRVEIIQFVGGG